jgi:hypothetical protein
MATLAGVAVALAPSRHYHAKCFLNESLAGLRWWAPSPWC